MTDRLELLAVVALGFLLDQVLGDPHWLYHPVRLIGAYISFLEKGIRKLFGEGERALLAGGVVLVVLVTGTTAVVSGGRRPDMTGTITSLVSRMVGLLFAARGMRPCLSRGMERLPPRKRVSPGMILTSPGFRSRAFRAAIRGRVGMISPPQRIKSGGETLLSGDGENSA